MTSFRFLHSADIHLDSPLKGLSGYEGNAAEKIRTATREALVQLVDLALSWQVKFLIIAGDLYDGDWRDYNTGLFFIRQMGRLHSAGIPVYLLYGNHDAESQITKRLQLPENVHVFGSSRPVTFKVPDTSAALHGQSYRERETTANLAAGYPSPIPGAFNIGVLHTGLGGKGGHANYSPCSIHDLANRGYNYWALGHVHQAEVLSEAPHIAFPGNLQGRHAKETGAKGPYLVTVEDGDVASLEHIPCDVVRWAVITVDLSGAASMGQVNELIKNSMEAAFSEFADGRLMACRIVLEGRTQLHNRLVASEGQVAADASAIALGLGDEEAWVEKVLVSTKGVQQPQMRDDAIGDLLRMLRDAPKDKDLLARIEDDVTALVRRLPPEIQMEADDQILKAAVDGDFPALVGQIGPYLMARLNTEGG